MKRTSTAELKSLLALLHISKDDTVLLHSDFTSLGLCEGGIEGFVKTLLETIGENGNLVVPTFSFSFCKNEIFDVLSSPCTTGVIPKFLITSKLGKRSLQGVHSFYAIGKEQEKILNLHDNSSFGPGSVFGNLFKRENTKVLQIGTPLNTFLHFVEEAVGVPYRFHKDFHGTIIDETRQRTKKTCSMYVRHKSTGTDVKDRADACNQFYESDLCNSQIQGFGIHRSFLMKDYYHWMKQKLEKDPLFLVNKDSYKIFPEES